MMKKYISLVLILFISFIFSGCNSEKNNIIRKVNVRLGIDLVDEITIKIAQNKINDCLGK